MKPNILLLDIDDCILPSNINYFGHTDDALELLEINLKRLLLIITKYNMTIQIISSWYSLFELKDDKLTFRDPLKRFATEEVANREWNKLETLAGNMICKYLSNVGTTLSSGNKRRDIRIAIEKFEKVVVIEDSDFSDIKANNYLYCKTIGFINGNIGYKIENFIQNKIKK
jgi:hypothetical protein